MILVASATMGALGLGAPAVLAAELVYDCNFDAFRQENVTGQNYEGVISGFAADSTGGAVSIRCYITVNGTEVGGEASGSGAGIATAAGPLSFAATVEDDIDICADVNGAFAGCFQGEHQQVQEVFDAIDGVIQLIEDLTSPSHQIICGTVPPGEYPPDIKVTREGDVYRGGTRVVDCPPYGDNDGELLNVYYVSSR